MEMSPESQDTCVSDLALSPSGCDTLGQSLVSLGPVLSFLLMNWMSIQKACLADLQGTKLQRGGHVPKMTEGRPRKISTDWAGIIR